MGLTSAFYYSFSSLMALFGLVMIVGSIILWTGSVVGSQALPSILLIGLTCSGVLLFFMSFIGCFSASTRNRNALVLFTLFLGIAMAAESVLGVVVLSANVPFDESLRTMWKGLQPMQRSRIENDYMCCGFEDSNDLPGRSQVCDSMEAEGCRLAIENWVNSVFPVFAYFLFALAGLQAIAFLSGFKLMWAGPKMLEFRKQKLERGKYVNDTITERSKEERSRTKTNTESEKSGFKTLPIEHSTPQSREYDEFSANDSRQRPNGPRPLPEPLDM